ncbi:MAG TPA: hypothetical protein VMV97_13440 [Sulfuriferula sp.]|nr:hypothetical protein [Sulfuriferula sp.]
MNVTPNHAAYPQHAGVNSIENSYPEIEGLNAANAFDGGHSKVRPKTAIDMKYPPHLSRLIEE